MEFKRNIGNADRIIRYLLAVILTISYFNGYITGLPGIVVLILAAMLIITSISGVCFMYRWFGINTRSTAH